ncbi:hypothetical protein Scep_030252 [Stephania cephalantha]|uniref:Uncharacterized protein n=1 Tax=Stephania cephalantha TaxID=152367 RepID=A0AAP0DZF3_9MAGN
MNRYDESHVPSWGIKNFDSVVGCDVIATELCYKACTTYDQAQASILSQESLDSHLNLAGAQVFRLNQELQPSLMEENAKKYCFKEECEKLKEENTVLRDTREMEIRIAILAHKASPDYHIELEDFMIECSMSEIGNASGEGNPHRGRGFPAMGMRMKYLNGDICEDGDNISYLRGYGYGDEEKNIFAEISMGNPH